MQEIGSGLPVDESALPSQGCTLHFVSLTRPYILLEPLAEHKGTYSPYMFRFLLRLCSQGRDDN